MLQSWPFLDADDAAAAADAISSANAAGASRAEQRDAIVDDGEQPATRALDQRWTKRIILTCHNCHNRTPSQQLPRSWGTAGASMCHVH